MFTVIQVLGLLKGKGEKVEVTENDEKKRKVTVEIETDSEEEKEEEMKPEKNENILVMMDSHSQSLDNSKPTSIFSYFKASNSTSSWPGARFPESSHSARVPALLAESGVWCFFTRKDTVHCSKKITRQSHVNMESTQKVSAI